MKRLRVVVLGVLAGAVSISAFAQVRARQAAADRKTYLANVSTLLKQKWPRNRRINIVCHGHSVPAGFFKTPVVDTFNAYPHLLHKGLKARYAHAVVNVIVTAIGGEASDRGARRFEADVLTHKPDIVVPVVAGGCNQEERQLIGMMSAGGFPLRYSGLKERCRGRYVRNILMDSGLK